MLTLYNKSAPIGSYRAQRYRDHKVVETSSPTDYDGAASYAQTVAKQNPGDTVEVVFVSNIFKGVVQAFEVKTEEPLQITSEAQ